MKVLEVMVPDPLIARRDETVGDFVLRVLESRHATAVIVDSENRLQGLVGIRDILRRLVPHYLKMDSKLTDVVHEGYLEERLLEHRDESLEAFVTPKVDQLEPDDSLMMAAVLMVQHGRNTLPVVRDGKLEGVVTRRSLMGRLVTSLRAEKPD